MQHIRTEIEIEAPDQRVWDVLTDLAGYSEWNPLIRQARGELKEGQRLELNIQPPGLMSRTVRVKILSIRPLREFRWLGRFGMPWVLDGDHSFLLEPLGAGRVRVVQCETFSGLLVPFLARVLVPNMRRGFEEMNQALKKRAEQPPG